MASTCLSVCMRSSSTWTRTKTIVPIFLIYLLVAVFIVPYMGHNLAFSIFYQSNPDVDRNKNVEENSDRLRAAEKTLMNYKDKSKQRLTEQITVLPEFCFVIVSVSRPAEMHFLTQVVAALLPQVVESESVFTVYNAEGSSHLEAVNLAKIVPVITKEGQKHVNQFEKEKEDYVFALKWCSEKRARFTVILEDDALPPSDFVSRLRFVLKHRLTYNTHNLAFLKLYYPEKWQGWSNERSIIQELILTSMFGGIILTAILQLIILRGCLNSPGLFNIVNIFLRFLLSFSLIIYMLLTLGRPHWLALRKISPHLSFVVPAPGCCTPAVLYPQDHLLSMIDYLQQTECSAGFPLDLALDKFALDRELGKLLVVPNLVKHIGFVSSLGKAWKNPREFRFR